MRRMRIAHTWDGRRVDDSEVVSLWISAGESALIVRIDAPFHGDPAPTTVAGSRWGLWNFEVVELFIGRGQQYTELEFGPYGHFLVLRLAGVRRVRDQGHQIDLQVERTGARWRALARIPHRLLPSQPWTSNGFSVHGRGCKRRYLCAQPTGGERPDFHQLHAFRRHFMGSHRCDMSL